MNRNTISQNTGRAGVLGPHVHEARRNKGADARLLLTGLFNMRREPGFTRIELAVLVSLVALLAVAAMPMLAASRGTSDRAACFNNLRQLGRAVAMWAIDHTEQAPWVTPTAEGGTRPSGGKTGNAWIEYLSLSNELATPQLLACPSDEQVKVASGWGGGPNGLANASFRANAISYLLGMHALRDYPYSLISADRNMRFSASQPGGCSVTLMQNAWSCQPIGFGPPTVWTNGLHGTAGHLLSSDGRVQFVASEALNRTLVGPQAEDNGAVHILGAR